VIGIRPALWVGVVIAMLAPIPVLLSPLRKLRDLPSDVAEVEQVS
jgi:hypothetical protein